MRQRKWGTLSAPADQRLEFAADTEPFTACGLQPVVTSVKGGDCMLFDTRLFHGGCSAEDPSGASGRESGRGPPDLLRAVYILGMAHTHLQTPEMLVRSFDFNSYWALRPCLCSASLSLWLCPQGSGCAAALRAQEARRKAYELDLFWPPPRDHAKIAAQILAATADLDEHPWASNPRRAVDLDGTLAAKGERREVGGEKYPIVREFSQAPAEVQRLIDPTWAAEHGQQRRSGTALGKL